MNNLLKYIEILSIEQLEDKYYLQVALHANEVTEVYWQIDEVTYENLYLQCDFTSSERFRLSFKIIENPLINKLVGRITRTYLTSSSMIDFQTTKEFKEHLRLIKLHSQENTLYQLEFIEQNIHGLYAVEDVETVDDSLNEETISSDEDEASDVQVSQVASIDLEDAEQQNTTEQAIETIEEIAATEIVEADILEEIVATEAVNADSLNEIEATEVVDVDTLEEVELTGAQLEQETEQVEHTPAKTEEANDLDIEQQPDSTLSLNTELDDQHEMITDKELLDEAEQAVEQPNVGISTLIIDELEEQNEPSNADENVNQATALMHLIEKNEQELLKKEMQADSTIDSETVQPIVPTPKSDEVLMMPIQTLLTLPTIHQDVQHASISRQEDEANDSVEEVTAAMDDSQEFEVESNATASEQQHAKQNEGNEKTNIAAEEEKVVDMQTIVSETASAIDPIDPGIAFHEQPAVKTVAAKQPVVEEAETHHLSNNMIALLAVAVAIFIAVAVYFAFFQQNANTLNTESAVASETTNVVTYNIEESFTFSLPSEYVALTFNRGPSPYTEQILDILKQYNYGATFFLQGNQVSLYPDLVKTVDANGHSIGHITSSHTLLTILETEEQRDALVTPKEEIEQLINKETLLVRPPFNTFNQNTISIQQEYGFKIVNSSLPLKSGNDVQADTIIQEFLNAKKLEGSIIGLDESQGTVEALPTILEKIKQSNLQVVILK